jgi:MFS family permease
LGYKSTRANLLSVPPYAAAAILTVAIGYIADRTRQRGLCNILVAILGIIGFSMLLGSNKAGKSYSSMSISQESGHCSDYPLSGVQYAGTFLGALGIYPCIANTISWASNNVEGVYKRGVTLGFVIGWGNLNGVVSSNIYRAKDKPRYYLGHGVVLAYMVLFLFGGSIVTRYLLTWENRKRRRGEREIWVQGKGHKEIEVLGDKRPDFLYTL